MVQPRTRPHLLRPNGPVSGRRRHLIQPGTSLGGFELQSSYLPGVTTAWFSAGRLIEFDRETSNRLNY
jgi:hypothetical protein